MYNPSDVGKKGSIFGYPYSLEESDLILIPVHLDVTVSYGHGTSKAPDVILNESSQLDLSLISIKQPWEYPIAMYDKLVGSGQNEIHRGRAKNIIDALEAGKVPEQDQLTFVNEYCEQTHLQVEETARSFLEMGKIVGVVGGDHSSPLGLLRALRLSHQSFGILQVDAHMDLRKAYEGFIYSHASIMYNALKEDHVVSLTQVGIRDFCEEEELLIARSEKDIQVFYDEVLKKEQQNGTSWLQQCKNIVKTLPDHVYISFDMDGLDPSLCPNTGTPVPGGLSFNEAAMLIEEVVRSGRKIVGFDVCEAGAQPWDANVAARIIYRIATLAGVSRGRLQFR